ncbi:hypothetical protein NDU88_002527 [Pleurodeles waltl]|uniref:Gypsy retrotransposon integrase-like protein 1 n=1 Tax=Pleurodeles waltl TaxID=8319 RepID=A0AAV7KV10_PLEWA|nr:hypothetical protein NDU88_002527 [Pleurodeles waltl]
MASLQVGSTVCPEQIRCHTEATLVSEGGVDLATLAAWPPNMQKYRQQLLFNGTSVEGLRDTGASVTMVTEKQFSPGQYLAGQTYPVTNADNQTKVHPMAMVTLEWGGFNGLKQVVVSSNIPVDCLLGNDLESSAWAEVELQTHAAMLGIPELVCVKTRAQCKAQGEKVGLEPGKRAQPTKRKEKTTGKPAATQQQNENLSSQEEVLPSEGTEPLELEPYQVELLGPGGPSREQLCKGQETCPFLEGLRQQAAEESNGKKTGTHRVYWEDGLLYTEARDPKPGATRRVVVPQEFREFILTLAHDIPLAGHLGQTKKWERLVSHFYWPNMSQKVKEFCVSCTTCQVSALVKEGWERPLHEPKQDTVDYVLGLRSRMAEYMEKASKNLEASQQLQKFWYDQKAAMVEFQPGQKVWVLEPVAPRALQDKWSSPYPVLEKKSQVTYLVDLGTSRSPKRVIHVNRLKLFHDRADVNLLMVTDEDQEA